MIKYHFFSGLKNGTASWLPFSVYTGQLITPPLLHSGEGSRTFRWRVRDISNQRKGLPAAVEHTRAATHRLQKRFPFVLGRENYFPDMVFQHQGLSSMFYLLLWVKGSSEPDLQPGEMNFYLRGEGPKAS